MMQECANPFQLAFDFGSQPKSNLRLCTALDSHRFGWEAVPVVVAFSVFSAFGSQEVGLGHDEQLQIRNIVKAWLRWRPLPFDYGWFAATGLRRLDTLLVASPYVSVGPARPARSASTNNKLLRK